MKPENCINNLVQSQGVGIWVSSDLNYEKDQFDRVYSLITFVQDCKTESISNDFLILIFNYPKAIASFFISAPLIWEMHTSVQQPLFAKIMTKGRAHVCVLVCVNVCVFWILLPHEDMLWCDNRCHWDQ